VSHTDAQSRIASLITKSREFLTSPISKCS
jgi:hypothetical protein